MSFRESAAILFTICAVSATAPAAVQILPEDLGAWTLEYSVSGSWLGIHAYLSLTEAGELTVGGPGDRGDRGDHVTTQASGALMATVHAFLTNAQREYPKPRPPTPDVPYTSLTLTANGRQYGLGTPAFLAQELNQTVDTVTKAAIVGTWTEAAWRLCKPTPQLTEMDPPIERLVFAADGSFTVSWRDSADAQIDKRARDPGLPAPPDLVGRYSLWPVRSVISMSFSGGPYTPRDFDGVGNFEIRNDRLVLHRIWLGTRRTKRKPDICELTFTRVEQGRLSHTPVGPRPDVTRGAPESARADTPG